MLYWRTALPTLQPEWRNWQTHGTQNPATFTGHVGSTPTSGTTLESTKPYPTQSQKSTSKGFSSSGFVSAQCVCTIFH